MSKSDPRAATTQALASRSAIAGALATHSRGIDRADANLLGSAYHAGATVDYGFFVGPASEFVPMLIGAQRGQPVTMHRTSNLWITVQGERARSESYVLAYVEHRADSASTQRWIGGRYLDTHEHRGGAWRLTHRTYVMDFNINRPGTVLWADPAVALASFAPRGGQGAADSGRSLLASFAAHFGTAEVSKVTSGIDDVELNDAIAKQALHDLSMAYARAVDRGDAALMRSVFHEDATVVSGVFNGSGADFAVKITAFVQENVERCFHSVANEWYEVRGDEAVGESYVIANVTASGNDVLTGGRYIDRYQRRGGVWKIKNRVFVVDWTNTQPTSHETGGMYAALTTRGCFGPADPVYAFWKE